MIDKGSCVKGFMWNASNCQCECEHLDYGNYKCRKELVDTLVEECTNILMKWNWLR